jgi:hypothetical protein
MGSGISLSREQIINIIKKEIEYEFKLIESKKIYFTDEGYQIYENFDNEENYWNKIKYLDSLK